MPAIRRVTIVPRPILPWLIAACAVAAVLVAVAALAPPAHAQEEGVAAQPADEASGIYSRQCAPCHGPAGEGDVGPPLNNLDSTEAERIEAIAGGGDGMPGFALTLSDAQIAAVAQVLDDFTSELIFTRQCAPCHGLAGEGTAVASGLGESGLSAAERLAVVTNGQGAMPAFGPTLTASQIEAVIAYADRLAASGVAPGDAASAELYGAQCAACHGPGGEGASGPSLLATTLGHEEQVALVTNGSGSMPGFGATLSAAEIEALVTYTEALGGAPAPAPDGAAGEPIYAEHCAVCHGSDGTGGSGPAVTGGLAAPAVATVVAEGQGSMPGFVATLSPDDIEAVAAFVAGLGGPPSPAGPEAVIAAGAVVYSDQCAGCHGADATGGSGPSLTTATASDDELRTIITAGRGTMPGFPSLSEDDLGSLIAYLQAVAGDGGSQQAGGGGEAAGPVAPSGQEAFLQVCAVCHGADGEGGRGPALYGTTLTVNEIISHVYGGHTPSMPAFEGVMEPEQVQAVARYVSSLQGPAASALAVDEEGDEGGGLGWVLFMAAIVGLGVLGGFLWWRSGRRTRGGPGAPPQPLLEGAGGDPVHDDLDQGRVQ